MHTPTVECLLSTVTTPSFMPVFETMSATVGVMSRRQMVRPVCTASSS